MSDGFFSLLFLSSCEPLASCVRQRKAGASEKLAVNNLSLALNKLSAGHYRVLVVLSVPR